jgi:hypothetical protein
MQFPMMGRPEEVDVEIESGRRNIGAAMRMMRGIALRGPIALAGLPDDMIVGDPSGFDVGAVEKDSQPLSSFAGRCASVCSSNSLATSALFEQSGELEAVMQITHAAVRWRNPPSASRLERPGLESPIESGAPKSGIANGEADQQRRPRQARWRYHPCAKCHRNAEACCRAD